MTRLRADALLVLGALIWGTAFVAQKQGNEAMGPVQFVGFRFLLTALLVAPLAAFEARRATRPLNRGDWRLAAGVGVGLAFGAVLQQWGLVTTSATHGGFLTALYLAMVPFVARVVGGTPLRLPILGACAVSVAGAVLLAGHIDLRAWNRGDLILIGADLAWAVQITAVGSFLKRADRPFFLSFVQAALTAVAALVVGFAVEPFSMSGVRAALPALLYAGLVSGGIAFTLQVLAQKHTPPAEAALIMSLESVFAAISGALFLGERLTLIAGIGCALILVGALGVELGPALLGAELPAAPPVREGEP
jgi:drug/metabolite transporter (DMT)-like permease